MSLVELAEQLEKLEFDELNQLLEIISERLKHKQPELEDWEEELIEKNLRAFEASGRKTRPWAEVKQEIMKRYE